MCYREIPEEQMKGNYCWKCLSILGKGPGYKSMISDKEAEKWLEGLDKRKEILKKEGKLSETY